VADFAHNLAGIEAITDLVRGLGRDVVVSFGMAGDRSDVQLRELGAALVRMRPKLVVLREQEEYMRGRGPGEVPRLLAEGVRAAGMPDDAIAFADDEVDSLERARAGAGPADVIVLLVHNQRAAVEAWAREIAARPGTLP
jgi:cyanophycin synthetase